MLGEGVYLPPSQLEAAFFSAAHAKKDILQLIERADRALKKVAWEFGIEPTVILDEGIALDKMIEMTLAIPWRVVEAAGAA